PADGSALTAGSGGRTPTTAPRPRRVASRPGTRNGRQSVSRPVRTGPAAGAANRPDQPDRAAPVARWRGGEDPARILVPRVLRPARSEAVIADRRTDAGRGSVGRANRMEIETRPTASSRSVLAPTCRPSFGLESPCLFCFCEIGWSLDATGSD